MYSLVQKRRWYYAFSLAIIAVGIVIMIYSLVTRGTAFELSIDFKGGSIYELKFTQPGANEDNIRAVFASYGDQTATIQRLGDDSENRWSVRASFHEEAEKLCTCDSTLHPSARSTRFSDGSNQHLLCPPKRRKPSPLAPPNPAPAKSPRGRKRRQKK